MQRIVNSLSSVVLWVLLGILVVGCASGGGRVLEIDVSTVPGQQHMPDELNQMLGELGYEWVPVFDPTSNRGVKVARFDDQYRMQFRHLEAPDVLIDVRIRLEDGFSRLDFYEKDRQGLSPTSERLLQELKSRAELEFGEANISIKSR